jgi:hypothetical protein
MKTFLIIIFIFLGVSASLFAQNDSIKIVPKKTRLNGHSFTSVNTSKSAFINTYFGSENGIGNTGTLDLPGIVLGDNEILDFTGSVNFFTFNINYRQKFNDWLALRLSMSAGGRIGSNMSTILVDGLNTFNGGSIGWDFSLARKQKFQMSGSIFVKDINGSFIDIAGYVEDIINNVPFARAVKNIPVLTVGIGGQSAYAFNETYGLQFGLDLSYGESFNRGKESFYSSFNISGDMDLMPRKQVPLGFALGYMISSNPEDTYLEFIYTNIFSAKIAYTGSSSFDLGLQFITNRVKLSDAINEFPMIFKSQIDFKFYF